MAIMSELTLRRGGAACAVSVGVVLLSGCGVTDDVTVDLSGARLYQTEAASCASLAGSSELRVESELPSRITIRVESADQRLGDGIFYDVTGSTEVIADGATTYEWTCVAHFAEGGRTMDATLLTFDPLPR